MSIEDLANAGDESLTLADVDPEDELAELLGEDDDRA